MANKKDRSEDVERTVDSVEENIVKNSSKEKNTLKAVDKKKKGNKKTVFLLIVLAIVLSIAPLFVLKGESLVEVMMQEVK